MGRVGVKTSSKRRVHGLAVAHVDDLTAAGDDESADGLSALAGVRLHEW